MVRNEFEMGENSPEIVLEQRMMAVAYEWHNYGKSTIGNRTDIERVPIERLQGLLSQVLPARQRRARRRRPVRREEGPRPDPQVLRPPAEAGAASSRRPTPRSRPRTASGSVTLRRVGDVRRGRRALPRPGRAPPRFRRGASPGPDVLRRPRRAGSTRPWSRPRRRRR